MDNKKLMDTIFYLLVEKVRQNKIVLLDKEKINKDIKVKVSKNYVSMY